MLVRGVSLKSCAEPRMGSWRVTERGGSKSHLWDSSFKHMDWRRGEGGNQRWERWRGFSLVPVVDTEMGRRHLNVLKSLAKSVWRITWSYRQESANQEIRAGPGWVLLGALLELTVGDGSRPHEGVCRGVRTSKRRKAEMGGGISGWWRSWEGNWTGHLKVGKELIRWQVQECSRRGSGMCGSPGVG